MSIDFISRANLNILNIQPYQPGKPIEELQRETGLTHVIKLASNENPLGASAKAIAAAQASLAQIHRYPDGSSFELRHKLAYFLNILPSQITLGTGSDNVLALIAQTFVQPEQEILISQYAFATFTIIAHAVAAKPIFVSANHWQHDLNAIANSITERTTLIFLANPNNPTGTWFTAQQLQDFLTKVPSQVIVVVDEAYYEYAKYEPNFPDTLNLQKKYPNLIVTRTFSKIYALAGLRVGYGISHPEIAELLNRIRLPFNVSIPGQAAAYAALDDHEHLQASLALNQQGMRQLSKEFDQMGLTYIPSLTNFITVDVGNGMAVYKALLELGIIVRPLVNYQMPNHLRVTIGNAEENEIFLAGLQKTR